MDLGDQSCSSVSKAIIFGQNAHTFGPNSLVPAVLIGTKNLYNFIT